jgi:transcriptional regulator with XRE-family HTH domain
MIEFMTPYEVMEKLVENIEKQRIRKEMTQSDLYKKAGLSASGYAKYIKNKNTSFENILKLLFALDMTSNIEALLSIEEFNSIAEIRDEQNAKIKQRVKKALK